MKKIIQNKLSTTFLIIILFSINGCVVRYVADYDASIKNEIIQVAKTVDLFWGDLLDTNHSERKYNKFKKEYNQIETDIRGLVMRNKIRTLNQESTRQANIALNLWIEDRSDHKKNDDFSDFQAQKHREQYNRVFVAMAKGEEVKNITTNN